MISNFSGAWYVRSFHNINLIDIMLQVGCCFSQSHMNSKVQTCGKLLCKLFCRLLLWNWHIKIWKDLVNMKTCFLSIWSCTENSDDWNSPCVILSEFRVTNVQISLLLWRNLVEICIYNPQWKACHSRKIESFHILWWQKHCLMYQAWYQMVSTLANVVIN